MFLGNAQVFGPETTQEEFFEGTMRQPVQDFLDGYNRLIFTYGVTNAGKTYTFQGISINVFSLNELPLFFKWGLLLAEILQLFPLFKL